MLLSKSSSIISGDIIIVIPCSKGEHTRQPQEKYVGFSFGTGYSTLYLCKVLKAFLYSENFICVTFNIYSSFKILKKGGQAGVALLYSRLQVGHCNRWMLPLNSMI